MKKGKYADSYPNLTIIILIQAIVFSSLWLWNEYVASYLTLIFPGIFLFLLILAGISDLIEPSRMPGWYYGLMIVSILVPLFIGAVFFFLSEGKMDWLV